MQEEKDGGERGREKRMRMKRRGKGNMEEREVDGKRRKRREEDGRIERRR